MRWWKSVQCLSMAEGRGLTVFLDPLSESPGCLPNIRRFTPICLAFPVVDNILLLVDGDFVFGMH